MTKSCFQKIIAFLLLFFYIAYTQQSLAYLKKVSPEPEILNSAHLVSSNISQYTLNHNTRLVFVNISENMRTLCYVDYSINSPRIYKFKDKGDVFSPEISPNGNYVAYSTSNPDLRDSKQSKIYVRNLDSFNFPPVELSSKKAFLPHWWVNPSTKDTFIIYTNSVADCNTTEWYSTKTFKQKFLNGSPIGEPVILIENGSFHDGLSPDGHFSVTSQSSLKMKNLVTGEVKLLFKYPFNGKLPTDSTQVSDASISPDSMFDGFCMFLDSGYNGKSTVTNCSYNKNQYLFVTNFTGKVFKWVRCPPGENSWKYPRWSNQLNFAVSITENPNGKRKNLYLIKLTKFNDEIHQLISGDSLADPYIWLSQNFPSKFDSAGRYDLPPKIYNQDLITLNLAGFWRCHDSMNIIFVGTSHTYNGIDPESFTHKTYNLGIPGFQLYESLSIINNYILNQCKQVRLIGMDLIISRLFFPKPDSLLSNLYSSVGYTFDKSHSFWKGAIPDTFIKSYEKFPLPQNYQQYISKTTNTLCKGWGSEKPIVQITKNVSITSPEYLYNFGELKKTADILKNRKIHLLLFIAPVSPYYASTPFYGPEGPNRDVSKSVIKQIRDLEKSNPYLHLYDANLDGLHDYNDDDALDEFHLCTMGAKKLSKRLDSLVTLFLK